MNILFLTIPVSLGLAIFFIVCFFKAVKYKQFEDLDTPAHAILVDDNDQSINKDINAKESLNE